jgi:glutathione peroxidase
MQRRSLLLAAAAALAAPMARAGAIPEFEFATIDGGTIRLGALAGRPVLIVNTASRCGHTAQYADLQALYDRFRDRGLFVLAVPSNDFGQELATNAAVAEFCAVNFDLDLPMAGITPVRGAAAHPFYAWLAREHGFVPAWNFNKVLLDGEGRLVATWGSAVRPTARVITQAIERLL